MFTNSLRVLSSRGGAKVTLSHECGRGLSDSGSESGSECTEGESSNFPVERPSIASQGSHDQQKIHMIPGLP